MNTNNENASKKYWLSKRPNFENTGGRNDQKVSK